MKQDNKEPTVSKIAKELELTREELVLALDTIQDTTSLIEPIYNQDGNEIYQMDQKQKTEKLEDSWHTATIRVI